MKKVLGVALMVFYVFGLGGTALVQAADEKQVKSDPTRAMKSIANITAGAKDPQAAAARIESMKRIAVGLKKMREAKEGKTAQY